MTEKIIIAMIAFNCIICTFCVCLITYDFIMSNRINRKKKIIKVQSNEGLFVKQNSSVSKEEKEKINYIYFE